MTKEPLPPTPRQPLPILLVLFAGSGCAALIYEIVWFQLLQLVIGSSAVSLGVLLGTFMGGMCLGSITLPRLIAARRHPLRVYALLELGIALLGLAVLFGVPYVERVYAATVGHGLPAVLLRGAVCAVCLLPPTVLMGATLPAVARWVETTPRGVAWLGWFYAGNIAGAVFGCLLAGFYLLRVHDVATATLVAAAINLGVALLSLVVAAAAPHAPAADTAKGYAAAAPGSWAVYVAIALSGASALGAEVVWTRLLSLLLGATVYTFSIILAVFLVGLGIGSSLGSALARGSARPRVALGLCQLLLAGAVAWAALMLGRSLPYWPVNPYLSSSPWFTFQLDLVRCLWAVLPAAVLWGASFPLALASVATPGRDPGRLVGGVYAANTAGAIAGATVYSLVLIGWVGTQGGQRVLIGLSAAAALLLLAPQCWPFGAVASPGGGAWLRRRLGGPVLLAAAGGLAALLVWGVAPVPWELVAFGRALVTYEGQWKNLFVGEGMNSSVAVTEDSGGTRQFHVSGKVEASNLDADMRLQRMLAHLPALIHPRPRSVLIVGCGAGVTSGSFVPYPGVERIVICEIEPLVPRVVAEYFAKENYDVVHDRRVEIVFDDARHYIRTTPETFDVITSDPIHPWVKGSATLYTREYFELCKRHLNPGGVMTQWVPLYESRLDVVKSEIATFFEAFPDGSVWGNPDNEGKGYDLVLLGQPGPTRVSVDEVQARLDRPDHKEVARSLKATGFSSASSLLATYAGRAADLRPWLEGAQINRDRDLRLQYLAGLWLNANEAAFIYDQMLHYRSPPTDLLVGSGPRRMALLRRVAGPPSDQ
jgi:spermidine synthase